MMALDIKIIFFLKFEHTAQISVL